MTATVQLAFPTDARADDLTPAEVAGVEARVRDTVKLIKTIRGK